VTRICDCRCFFYLSGLIYRINLATDEDFSSGTVISYNFGSYLLYHFAISPFAISPFRHFAISPFRHFAIRHSLSRHFAILPFRHFTISCFKHAQLNLDIKYRLFDALVLYVYCTLKMPLSTYYNEVLMYPCPFNLGEEPCCSQG